MSELPIPGSMAGRTVVITGASSGIGGAAARALAMLGAEVAVVGRNPDRTRAAAEKLGGTPFVADFGRLSEVRDLASALLAKYPRIHVLANNAGGIQPKQTFTGDRNERTLQESHLGGFLLTNLLLPRLRETAAVSPAGALRVIQTASSANRGGRLRLDDLDVNGGPWLGGWRAYGNAKLANILHTRELARRLHGSGIAAYAFHPGIVVSNFGSTEALFSLARTLTGGHYGLSPEQGAEPLIRLAAAPAIEEASGTYYSRLTPYGATAAQADDANLARAFWAASEVRVDPNRV